MLWCENATSNDTVGCGGNGGIAYFAERGVGATRPPQAAIVSIHPQVYCFSSGFFTAANVSG
jgi:hypothetical protein